MDIENKYASRGVGGTALGLAIGSLGLQTLNGGLGGILGGGRANCNEDHTVNRYEAAQAARIAELETEVKLRDSNIYTDSKILDLYRYVDGKLACVESQLCEQRVYNATNTSALGCLQGQVAQLLALTKIVVPAANICPAPMPQYNSWTAPTAAPATGA
jgi:hypothetical protein